QARVQAGAGERGERIVSGGRSSYGQVFDSAAIPGGQEECRPYSTRRRQKRGLIWIKATARAASRRRRPACPGAPGRGSSPRAFPGTRSVRGAAVPPRRG